jgi:hypothetical protein
VFEDIRHEVTTRMRITLISARHLFLLRTRYNTEYSIIQYTPLLKYMVYMCVCVCLCVCKLRYVPVIPTHPIFQKRNSISI